MADPDEDVGAGAEHRNVAVTMTFYFSKIYFFATGGHKRAKEGQRGQRAVE